MGIQEGDQQMLFCFNATEVFRIAIEIKDRCVAFYEKAQGVIQNSEANQLFENLVREKTEHKVRIENLKAKGLLGPGRPRPGPTRPQQLQERIQRPRHDGTRMGRPVTSFSIS